MTVAELAGKLLAPESPWFLVVAAGLLVAAAGVARRLWSSVRRIGERVGKLETVAESEQTRRRQVEATLLELGVPLPIWPADPVNLRELAVLRGQVSRLQERSTRDASRPAPASGGDSYDDEHQDDEHPLTSEAPLPPVPAGRQFARHGSR